MISKQEVSPKNIEDSLIQIWDSLQGKNKMRSSLFNLVIYAKNDEREPYLRSIVKRVMNRFPCRIIFVTEEEKAMQPIKAFASVISASEGNLDIFCDAIDLHLSPSAAEHASFLVLPHLMPDLPVYLIWGGSPKSDHPMLKDLQSIASKIIFDSENSSSLYQFASGIFFRLHETSADLIDLNWARTEEWRNLISATFYSPESLNTLKKTDRIEITYNCHQCPEFQHQAFQASYLQGWLASTLGWNLQHTEDQKSIYQVEGRYVLIEQKQAELSDVKPGRVLCVSIDSENGENFHFSRKKAPHHIVEIYHSTATYCESPGQYLFNKEESEQSFSNEIFHAGTSKHFLKTLKYIEEGTCEDRTS